MSNTSNSLVSTVESHEEGNDQIEISKVNGRTQIVFKKALLRGKVSPSDVLNSILIAARMQTEKYIEKLSRGAPLDVSEIKALKELADITKLTVPESPAPSLHSLSPPQEVDRIKQTLYAALADKLSQK